MPGNSVRIWTRSSIPALMTEATRGVLDTSLLIDHDLIAAERLPDEVGGRYLGSTAVRCGLGTNVRQDFCCRKSSRARFADLLIASTAAPMDCHSTHAIPLTLQH